MGRAFHPAYLPNIKNSPKTLSLSRVPKKVGSEQIGVKARTGKGLADASETFFGEASEAPRAKRLADRTCALRVSRDGACERRFFMRNRREQSEVRGDEEGLSA